MNKHLLKNSGYPNNALQKTAFVIKSLLPLIENMAPLAQRSFELLTPKCQLCGDSCDCLGTLCRDCKNELPTLQLHCPTCALPASTNSVCGDCLKTPKPYQRTRCALLYENPVNYLMDAFKNHAQWQIGRFFCQLWLQQHQQTIVQLQQSNQFDKAVIVPVPSYAKRSAQRGYTPSILLAEQLSRATHIPVKHALMAAYQPAPQKTLCRKQRLQNLTDVFQVENGTFTRAILIDDVITSCATAIAASEALTRSGVKHIEVWAIARTPLS